MVYTRRRFIIDPRGSVRRPGAGQTWKPKNYKDTFPGPTLLREALAQSRNV